MRYQSNDRCGYIKSGFHIRLFCIVSESGRITGRAFLENDFFGVVFHAVTQVVQGKPKL